MDLANTSKSNGLPIFGLRKSFQFPRVLRGKKMWTVVKIFKLIESVEFFPH